jgi:hypothetical protein
MVKARLLAFLLCDNATRDRDGKITLHGLFDRMIAPRARRDVKILFVYYRIVVERPCVVSLRVINPEGDEIPEASRSDSLSELGPVQTVWSLSSGSFTQRGNYVIELRQDGDDSEPLTLAQMSLTVEEREG